MKYLKCYALVFCLAACLPACSKKETGKLGNHIETFGTGTDPIQVECQLVDYGDFPIELISNGKLEAFKRSSMRFRGSERVVRIYYQNGDWVDSGKVIAELDDRMEKLDLSQALLRMERVRLDRLVLIAGHQIGAKGPEDIPCEALKRFNMQTGYDEAELACQQARIRYDYTKLTASMHGRMANLECREQNFPAGDKPFCLLINDEQFDVIFPVMENEIVGLYVGQDVSVRPFSRDSIILSGRITEINPLVDEHGNVMIKARVPNLGSRLIEGMNVKVIIKELIPGGLIVPKESVVLRNNQQVVFSLHNGRSCWNYVESDLENSSSYSIRVLKAGILKAGDTIITRGNLNLANDCELQIRFNTK